MRTFSRTVLLAAIALLAWLPIQAYKPQPKLTLDQIAGQWIGQCPSGEVFALDLRSDGTGLLRYIKPWDTTNITIYQIADTSFDGWTLRLNLSHRDYGNITLEGAALKHLMRLKIKKLFHHSTPDLPLTRIETWNS